MAGCTTDGTATLLESGPSQATSKAELLEPPAALSAVAAADPVAVASLVSVSDGTGTAAAHSPGKAGPAAAPTAVAQAAAAPPANGTDPLPVASVPLPEDLKTDAAFAGAPARGGRLSLPEAVRRAILDNARIGIAEGRTHEALAGIGQSRSSLYPQVDVNMGSGQSTIGGYRHDAGTDSVDYWSPQNAAGAWRTDVGVSGRQLLYDFGATRKDVRRAELTRDSESLKLQAQVEEIANGVTDAYLKILEQRELMSIADSQVTTLRQILNLINESERNGNGTQADTKRVTARLIEADSLRSDAESALQSASDQFRRLVGIDPGPLKLPGSLTRLVPASMDSAVGIVPRANPLVLAADAALRAAKAELESQKASILPKIQFEADATGKHFKGHEDHTDVDLRVMLALRYKIMDGGLSSSQTDQVQAKILQAEMQLRDRREEVEADLRQFYRTLANASGKSSQLEEGVVAAAKAKELYSEQFRGGKRSLLDLLEVESAYTQARRSAVVNRFDAQRATYGILRGIGRLTATMLSKV